MICALHDWGFKSTSALSVPSIANGVRVNGQLGAIFVGVLGIVLFVVRRKKGPGGAGGGPTA